MGDFTDKIIDIGANLTNRQFRNDLRQVLRRAEGAGLESILLTGTSMRSSRDALRMVRQRQADTRVQLFATIGVHPHDAKEFDETCTPVEMRELLTQNLGIAVAVGECGLDFNRDFSPRDKQERVFQAQVELACELQLPLFLHERDAHEAFVRVLLPFVESGRLPPVVVHCFTGNASDMERYISMGFYIGLTGFICMESRGRAVREMAARIPLDKLLIETDAPYMYPYGNNKRSRCEPKDLRVVVHTLAACYGCSPSEIAVQTTRNARRFFQIGTGHAASTDSKAPIQQIESQSTSSPTTMPTPGVSALTDEDAIVLDGGSGEGGGQVLRIAMALASVLKKQIRVHSIRANRKVPGLRNQHVRTVQLAQSLSHGLLHGAQLGSSEIVYDARTTQLDGGEFLAVSETGGSVSLMIQGSLPAMLFASQPTTLMLRGGTHVGFSPPVDFMQIALSKLLARMGAPPFVSSIRKRCFTPPGQGEVTLSAAPMTQPLTAIECVTFSNVITKLSGKVTLHGATATDEVAQQYVAALKREVQKQLPINKDTMQDWDVVVEVAAATTTARFQRGKGRQHGSRGKHHLDGKPDRCRVSILVMLETETGGLLTVDRTESRDTPEYFASQMVPVLATHLENEVCMDEHLADNAIVYMALAAGTSQLRVPRQEVRTSQHLETALMMASRLTGATIEVVENDQNAVVTVHGIAFVPATGSSKETVITSIE